MTEKTRSDQGGQHVTELYRSFDPGAQVDPTFRLRASASDRLRQANRHFVNSSTRDIRYIPRHPRFFTVRDAMSRAPIWCYEDDVLTEAARHLEESHIRRLLVLDYDRKLVGLVSMDDLALNMSSDRLLGEMVRNITAAAPPLSLRMCE